MISSIAHIIRRPQIKPTQRWEAAEMAKVFHALSHPDRIRILQYIHSEKPGQVKLIMIDLHLTSNKCSAHLRVLREAGLVRESSRFKGKRYLINDDRILFLKGKIKMVTL